MIRLAIARTVDGGNRIDACAWMRRVAGIDPPPAHWLVRGVSKAFGVRPRFTIDHGNLVGRSPKSVPLRDKVTQKPGRRAHCLASPR